MLCAKIINEKKDITFLNKRANGMQKKNEEDESKIDELEQNDRWQSLEFH